MTEPRPELERVAPTGDGHGPRTRLRIAVALAAVAGVVGLALAVGGGPFRAPSGLTVSRSAFAPPTAESTSDTPNGSSPPAVSAPSPDPPGPPTAALPPESGLIAVVDDDGALSTVDAVGGSRASYPAPGVVFGFPAWSPDGSRIAVVGESATEATAIYVFTVAPAGGVGEPPTIVYQSGTGPPFYLYWTPDGGHISFLTSEDGVLALRIAPVDGIPTIGGSAPSSVLRQGAPLYFDWIDPTRVLVHVGSGREAFVGELGLDGSPTDLGTSSGIVGNGIFRPAVVSHDARYFAYVTGPPRSDSAPGSGDAVVISARDRSTSRRVPVFGPTALLFDPTGDTLATIGAVHAATDTPSYPVGPLRLIDAASGEVRTLLDGSVVTAFWSPDGRTIAALEVGAPGQIPVAGSPGGTARGWPAASSSGGVADLDPTAGAGTDSIILAGATVPLTAPDVPAQSVGVDARLVFVDVSTGAVRSTRVVRLADHFIDQLLPYFDQYALSHHLWSPDSAALLLPLVDPNGKDRLVVLSADGSPARPIADGPKGFWSP